MSKKYRPFKKARAYARKLKLKNQKQWRIYSKTDKKPDDIPTDPGPVYINDGWKGYGDWLGNGNEWLGNKSTEWREFNKARAYVRKLKLKGWDDWQDYCKSGKKPKDIPANCDTIPAYKSEWIDMGDWLGNEKFMGKNRKLRSFKDAKTFVHKLNLKSTNEWNKYCKSGKKPKDIPQDGAYSYKKEWKGWNDFLGTSRYSAAFASLSIFECQKITSKLGLKGRNEWYVYCKSGKKPKDIPMDAFGVYKKEFTSWGDFLGSGNVQGQLRDFYTYEEAEKEAHIICEKLDINSPSEWKKAQKEGKLSKRFPSHPWQYYAEWKKK